MFRRNNCCLILTVYSLPNKSSLFSGDLDESKTLSNIQWGTGIKEASKETLGTAAEKAQTLTGESEAKEFAKTIQEHLNEDNKLEVRVEKNDSTTVANLNAGYYLIKDKELPV